PAPIGKPIYNAQLFILGSSLELLPVGVVGELCIQGEGVGAGYLNRAGLTAGSFVASPYGRPGERMYRTGDLGLYREDGSIVYRGRTDHQVKIRGNRIELGEIQAVITEYEEVADAAVIMTENDAGEKQVVAYIVTNQEKEFKLSGLRRYLK